MRSSFVTTDSAIYWTWNELILKGKWQESSLLKSNKTCHSESIPRRRIIIIKLNFLRVPLSRDFTNDEFVFQPCASIDAHDGSFIAKHEHQFEKPYKILNLTIYLRATLVNINQHQHLRQLKLLILNLVHLNFSIRHNLEQILLRCRQVNILNSGIETQKTITW